MPCPLFSEPLPERRAWRLRLVWTVFLLNFFFSGWSFAQILPPTVASPKKETPTTPASVSASLGTVETAVRDSEYVVGPGDVLSVSIFADRYYFHELPVSSDGSVVIPVLGSIAVSNLTLADVRARLGALVEKNFRSGEVIVTLLRARQVKVSVTGAVLKPGVVSLPASARVSEALELAGGVIKDTTALRGIRIRRLDGTERGADLTSFFREGTSDDNPFVMGGDIISVPRIDGRVGVFGAVNFEGHVDFVPGDRLFTCLRLAGGLRSSVFRDSVQIVRFNPDQVTTTSFYVHLKGYPRDSSQNIPMHAGDLVLVRAVPKFQKQRLVVLIGEIMYPGSYPIMPGVTTLREILSRAGGLTPEASLEEATITRKQNDNERDREYERLSRIPPADMQEDEYEYFKARSRERVGQMAVNFKKLIQGKDLQEDITLEDGDVIDIPFRKNYVRVLGRVNAPGNVLFRASWTFRQYIEYCDGYGWRADEGNVRVIKARTGELVDATDTGDYVIEPGDAIWVPEEPKTKFWEVALTTLSVVAQLAGIVGIVYAVTR